MTTRYITGHEVCHTPFSSTITPIHPEFVFQTTAHTLCFALGLLALFPGEQEKVYEEVLKVIPGDKDPVRQALISCTLKISCTSLRRSRILAR